MRFQAGLRVDSGVFYIERAADDALFERLSNLQLAAVLAPRQVGKSSLCHRVANRLQKAGICTVMIDDASLGVASVEPVTERSARLFFGLANRIADELGLVDTLLEGWEKRKDLAPLERLRWFLLEQVCTGERRVVVFLDEIDRLRAVGLSADAFFAFLRETVNERPVEPRWKQLAFCVAGVATIDEIASDPKNAAFAVPSMLVRIDDFTREQLDALAPGLAPLGTPGPWLDAIFDWTAGHPLLTQTIAKSLVDTPPAAEDAVADTVEARVTALFLSEGLRTHPVFRDTHRRFAGSHGARPLALYRQILKGRVLVADGNRQQQLRLRVGGLVAFRGNHVVVRNRIFAELFNAAWIDECLADRPFAEAIAAWLKSREERLLPTGSELARLAAWAAKTELTSDELAFLEAARRRQTRTARRNQVFFATVGTVSLIAAAIAIFYYLRARAAESRALEAAQRARNAETAAKAAQLRTEKQLYVRRVADMRRKGEEPGAELEDIADALRLLAEGDEKVAQDEFTPDELLASGAGEALIQALETRDFGDIVLGGGFYRATTLATTMVRAPSTRGEAALRVAQGSSAGFRVWDPPYDSPDTSPPLGGNVAALAFSDDGATLFAVVTDEVQASGAVSEWMVRYKEGRVAHSRWKIESSGVVLGPEYTVSNDGVMMRSQLSHEEGSVLLQCFDCTGSAVLPVRNIRGARFIGPSRFLVDDGEKTTLFGYSTSNQRLQVEEQARWASDRFLVLSDDGQEVLLREGDGSGVSWEGVTGRVVNTLPVGQSVKSGRFASDKSRIILYADESATVWSRTGAELARAMTADRLRSAEFLPDARILLHDNHCEIWDPELGTRLVLDSDCAKTADPSFVFEAQILWRTTARLRGSSSRSGLGPLSLDPHWVHSSASLGEEGVVTVQSGETRPGWLHIDDATDGATLLDWPLGNSNLVLGVSDALGATRAILWDESSKRIGVADISDETVGTAPPAPAGFPVPVDIMGRSRLIAETGEWVFAYCGLNDSCREDLGAQNVLVDLAARRSYALPGLPASEFTSAAAFSFDGTQLITVGKASVRLWSLQPGQEPQLHAQADVKGCKSFVSSIDMSGRLVVLACDGAGYYWDSASTQGPAPLTKERAMMYTMAFSQDGSHFSASDYFPVLRVFEWGESGAPQQRAIIRDTTSGVLSPSGDRWADHFGTLWRWPAQSDGETEVEGRAVLRLPGGSLEYTQFSPDGNRLLVSRPKGGWQIHDIDVGPSLRAEACNVLRAEKAIWDDPLRGEELHRICEAYK
ncbi:MAG: AAA-like domain-containing protein [Polyangiaceae bacterium]